MMLIKSLVSIKSSITACTSIITTMTPVLIFCRVLLQPNFPPQNDQWLYKKQKLFLPDYFFFEIQISPLRGVRVTM